MIFTFVFLLLITSTLCGPERLRVFHGEPLLGRNTPYSAVRYYAALGTHHAIIKYPATSKGILPWYLLLANRTTTKAWHACSGGLMTPSIIQTACHCLAYFDQTPDEPSGTIRTARPKDHWENKRLIFLGVNWKEGHEEPNYLTVAPLQSNKFFLHSKCAKVDRGSNFQVAVYDYGWVRTNKDWLSGKTGVPVKSIDFMPMYMLEELKRIYYHSLNNQIVCLTMGFGRVAFNEESNVLRHGWGVLVPYDAGFKYTTLGVRSQDKSLISAICTVSIPKHINETGLKGDSGSPITCGNHLLGVFSYYTYYKSSQRGKPVTEMMGCWGPIYSAPYENAIEFREDFEKYVATAENGVSYVDYLIDQVLQSSRPFRLRFFHDTTVAPSFSSSNNQPFAIFILTSVSTSILNARRL